MRGPHAAQASARAGEALTNAELGSLTAGARVVVERSIPASGDRPAQLLRWFVGVAEVCCWSGDDGWSLVPASSQPEHRGDFHIGLTGHGMCTRVHRSATG